MRGKNDLVELDRIELLIFDQTGDCSGFENLTLMSNDVHSYDDTFPCDEHISPTTMNNASEAETSNEAFGREGWLDDEPELFPRNEPKDLNEPC